LGKEVPRGAILFYRRATMDKVAIFGTYHFLGFNLCEKMLEEGIEVVGYRFCDDDKEEYIEHKQFLIGRNANFTEKILTSEDEYLFETTDESTTILIFSFYDLYFSTKEMSYTYIQNFLTKHISTKSYARIIILFPIEFLKSMPKAILSKINQLKGQSIKIQAIYLPTIYGPWQSSLFMFQQYLLKNQDKRPKLDHRENTTDAIYIKDVVDKILRIIDSLEASDLVIKSGKLDQWKKGIQYLQAEDLISWSEVQENNNSSDEEIKVLTIDNGEKIETGLEIQKKHTLKLL
jgi:hypothetical protein